jgi:hypothetical protein
MKDYGCLWGGTDESRIQSPIFLENKFDDVKESVSGIFVRDINICIDSLAWEVDMVLPSEPTKMLINSPRWAVFGSYCI